MKTIQEIAKEHIVRIATRYPQDVLEAKVARTAERKRSDPALVMLAQVMAQAILIDSERIAAVVDLTRPDRSREFVESALVQMMIEWEDIQADFEAQFPKVIELGGSVEPVEEPSRAQFGQRILAGIDELILAAKKENLEKFRTNEWGRDRAVGMYAAKELVKKLINEPWDQTKEAETSGQSKR